MSKRIGIMQPYFLPYIGYWQLINAVDEWILYDDVQFMKRSFMYRNKILLSGKPHSFSVSIGGQSTTKRINEVVIVNDFRKFQKTIMHAYHKAPNFEAVCNLLSLILDFPDRNFAKFSENSIRKITEYLAINTEIIVSSTIKKDQGLSKEQKLITLCKDRCASHYINAIGGIDLYSKDNFHKEGIKLSFLKTNNISYRQFNNEFVPNLSIIDVMMFNSVGVIKRMLNQYSLE
jgi:hypothetical protein